VTEFKVKGSRARIFLSSELDAAAKALTGHVVGGKTLEVVVNHEEQTVVF